MKIYAYTFPSYIKDNEKYPIKVGCTTIDVRNRVLQQMTTSNWEIPILLYESDDVQFDDYKIHNILMNYGEKRPNPRREWFITDAKTISRAVNEAGGSQLIQKQNFSEEVSPYAWLWVLLFGCFYFVVKGVWRHALISSFCALFTNGLSWLIYPFFASSIMRKHYLREGWVEIKD